MAAKPKLTRKDVRYLERAVRIRRKLSNKALAAKFGLTPHAVQNYVTGAAMPLEDWRERRINRGFAPN